MITVNMKSKADAVQGQGVLSAYLEQVELVKSQLSDTIQVSVNGKDRYDITHYHTINLEFFLEIPIAKRHGATVGYVHFLPETVENSLKLPSLAKKIFYWYLLKFYKSMDFLVVVNPYFISLLERYGIKRDKIAYIPNFVSDSQFYKIHDTTALREKYNVSPSRFVVLCVGQLQTRKGVLDFIDVAKKMPHLLFLWAGDAVFGKISAGYQDIQKAMQNKPDNLRFLGLIPREQMNGLYNIANTMFLPSYEELFPMTILEAMNCGVPILLRNLEIYHDILFDYYLAKEDNDGFVACLEQLCSDDDFYKKASESSFRGHQFYHKDHVAQLWKTFYQQVTDHTQ